MSDVKDGGPASVADQCRSMGGLTRLTLGDLRDVLGKKKLGSTVLVNISELLQDLGLGYFPEWRLDPAYNQEPRQWQELWLYDPTSGDWGRVIQAVLNPDEHDVRAVFEGLVGGRIDALTAEQKLERIRDLVISA